MPKKINSFTKKEIQEMITTQSEKDKKEIYPILDKLRENIIDLNNTIKILGGK